MCIFITLCEFTVLMLMCAYHGAGCKRNMNNQKKKKNSSELESLKKAFLASNRTQSTKFERISQNMEEKQSSEGVTEPPRTAAMLSTCLSRSCVGVTPATHLTSYWPGCASHLVLLSSLLAGDPNKAHLTGKRAMPGDRAVLWMKPSLMTHPSICDPTQMLVNLTAGSVTGAVALLTLIKHTRSRLVNNTRVKDVFYSKIGS